jgi:serine/threonine protein kinase
VRDLPDELLNRYEILSQIGSGGSGTVLKARDRVLKRLLAIKILKTDRSVPLSHYANLQREAKTICRLKHPNIIDVYDFIVTQDQKPVMLMEYVDGRSLDQIVKEDGPLGIRKAVLIVLEICRAMEYAHKQGILHRDLTARNVIVSEGHDAEDLQEKSGLRVMLLDFGIAKVQELQDRTISSIGCFMGTASVASPEQARGEDVDERSDIYSLGCTMYKILTGKSPLVGDSILATLHKQISEDAPSLSSGNPDIAYPARLEEIVGKALKKSPADRFQRMRALELALESFLNELETASPANASVGHDAGPGGLRRKKVNALLLVACAMLLVGAFVWFSGQVSRDAPQGGLIAPASVNVKRKNQVHWLMVNGRLNDDCFDLLQKRPDIKRVQIAPGTVFSPADLSRLMSFKLIFLDMRQCEIDDNCLEIISHCGTLRSLVLSRCQGISDSGLKHLWRLKQLEILTLDGTGIGDRGVKTICNLSNLNERLRLLYLSDTKGITDASVPYLMKLRLIQILEVGHTKITQSGVKQLFQLPKLISLNVAGLDLKDDDIPDNLNDNYVFLILMDNPKLTDQLFDRIRHLKLSVLDVTDCPRLSQSEIDRYELEHVTESQTIVLHSGAPPVSTDPEHYLDPSFYDLSGYDPIKMKAIMINSQVAAMTD